MRAFCPMCDTEEEVTQVDIIEKPGLVVCSYGHEGYLNFLVPKGWIDRLPELIDKLADDDD